LDYTKDIIFGKDKTLGVVCVEPKDDHCVLFIQNNNGEIVEKNVENKQWILYTEKYSDKMLELSGNQPYKYLMEYSNKDKYADVIKSSREKQYDLYTMRNVKESFLTRYGVTYYKGLKVKDVSVLSFDTEHTFGIGDKLNRSGKLLLISNTYRSSKGDIVKKLFSFDEFQTEKDMLNAWCIWVKSVDPSIIIGHNIFGHDFKILDFAATRARINLNLGRDGSKLTFDKFKSFKRKDGSQSYEFKNPNIYGRELVDTFFLALTFDVGRVYESYSLKQIIKQEGLEKKDRTHYDASQIYKNYTIPEEWKKIKEYAKDDADDPLSLFDLMIPSLFYSTQSIPRSLQHVVNSASGGQINAMMVRAYLQQNHSISKASDSYKFKGAISFGVPGIHRNVLRFDVASLYPSIIRQYKIFPEKKDEKKIFLEMVEYFTIERLKNKKTAKDTGDRYYEELQQAQKILINSMYGFMGAGKLNYNHPDGANEVTRYGREILKKAILWATGNEYVGEIEETEIEHEDT
jgi:DNA polymerase, archaea type